MAPFRELLAHRLARLGDQLAKADAPMTIYRYQGEYIAVKDLLQAMTKVSEALGR